MQIRVQQLAATFHFLALRKCLPRDDDLAPDSRCKTSFSELYQSKGSWVSDMWSQFFYVLKKLKIQQFLAGIKMIGPISILGRGGGGGGQSHGQESRCVNVNVGVDAVWSVSHPEEEIWLGQFIAAEKKSYPITFQSPSDHFPISFQSLFRSLSDLLATSFRSPFDHFSGLFPITFQSPCELPLTTFRSPSDHFPIFFRSLPDFLPITFPSPFNHFPISFPPLVRTPKEAGSGWSWTCVLCNCWIHLPQFVSTARPDGKAK